MKKRKFAVFLLAAFFASTYVTCAGAAQIPRAEAISEGEDLSVTVELDCDEVSGADVGISLYQVAEVEVNGGAVTYTALTGDADYAGMTAEESSETAAALAESDLTGLVSYSGTTGTDGELSFTVSKPGVYLVVQDTVQGGFVFEPFLVPVPQAVEEDGVYVWNYQVICEPKAAVLSASQTDGDSSTASGFAGNKTASGTQAVYTSVSGGAKTGDGTGLVRWIVLSAAAAGAACAAGVKIRKGAAERTAVCAGRGNVTGSRR